MRIRDIRKLNAQIYENNELIYAGPIDDVLEDLKTAEVKKIQFKSTDVILEI